MYIAKPVKHSELIFVIGICLSVGACGTMTRQEVESRTSDIVFIDKPDVRHRNPDHYFSHEYRYLNERRKTPEKGDAEPTNLVGLALSGGGIRSAAFQLGLLSGLSATKTDGGKSLLDTVDYISSVSGGSWANGMYWSSAAQSDGVFFGCLDYFAERGFPGPGCQPPYDRLQNSQHVAILPDIRYGKYIERKELWTQNIVFSYLGPCDIDFDQKIAPAGCPGKSTRRPYPIFNSTHSSASDFATAEHHPFQSTPDQIGTVDDKQRDGGTMGFFLKTGSDGPVQWRNYKIDGDLLPGNRLSLILSHSSGVLGHRLAPLLLSYNFHLRFNDSRLSDLRGAYVLSDGGKSDNTGILPLLERNVGTIVMSQIGKEKKRDPSEEDRELGDMKLALEQSVRLFGCAFPFKFAHDDAAGTNPLDMSPVLGVTYSGCHSGRGGRIVVIRPTVRNVYKFTSWLRSENPELARDVEVADQEEERELINGQGNRGLAVCQDCFPETPTFDFNYPIPLIRAYYLLGKYIAQNDLRSELEGAK